MQCYHQRCPPPHPVSKSLATQPRARTGAWQIDIPEVLSLSGRDMRRREEERARKRQEKRAEIDQIKEEKKVLKDTPTLCPLPWLTKLLQGENEIKAALHIPT